MRITPIPLGAGKVGGWPSVTIRENGESLVPIGSGTAYDDLITSAVYAGEHLHSPYHGDNVIDAATTTIYVRRSVAERLRHAQSLLPSGKKLIIFDGYRSVAVQRALFDQFASIVRELHPTYADVHVIAATEPYVALPSTDPRAPSPHSTGGAVDVAIIEDNVMIEFGTPFDHGSERSALRYFEEAARVQTASEKVARRNRRLLYRVMHEAGMQAFEHEWWHFNAPETQMGARACGTSIASFGIATPGKIPKQAIIASTSKVYAHVERITPPRPGG